MLFIRRNVPARMPDVSANASFYTTTNTTTICQKKKSVPSLERKVSFRRDDDNSRTHHLAELYGRFAHLIPNPDRDLNKKKFVSCTHACTHSSTGKKRRG